MTPNQGSKLAIIMQKKKTHQSQKQTNKSSNSSKKKKKRQDNRVQNISNVISLSYPKVIECKMYLM